MTACSTTYLDVLREEVAACPDDRYRVHAGMREAIDGAGRAGRRSASGPGTSARARASSSRAWGWARRSVSAASAAMPKIASR